MKTKGATEEAKSDCELLSTLKASAPKMVAWRSVFSGLTALVIMIVA